MKLEIEDLRFDERGLVPAVVQDAATGEVLTLAYMSAESLRRTLRTGETWFWSRSRSELWHKGGTSGHTQRVRHVAADCDADALTISVEPRGPACHTGARSCFGREVVMSREGSRADGAPTANDPLTTTGVGGQPNELGATLAALYELIGRRRRELPEGSYTAYLFKEGLDKILKKVGEESAETIIAAKNADAARLVAEVSDLVYHLLVLLAERGVALEDVDAELARRALEGVSG